MALTTTTKYALPYPVDTDTPDVPRDVKALADKVDVSLMDGIPSFANAAARDTAYAATAVGGPHDGSKCYLQDVHQEMTYVETAWAPSGGRYPALGLNANIPNVALPAGYSKLTGTNATGPVQGGATVQSDAGFNVPNGNYMVNLMVRLFCSANFYVEGYIGTSAAQIWTMGNLWYPGNPAAEARAMFNIPLGLAGVFYGWLYLSQPATIAGAFLNVMYVGPRYT